MKFIVLLYTAIFSVSAFASSRDVWQKSEKIFKAIGNKKRVSVFCEIGSGDGYFSLKAAKLFDKVYASDVDEKSLKKLKEIIRKHKVSNLEVVTSKYDDAMLPLGKCDVIFMGMVYHHIEDRVQYLKNMKKYLSPKGRFFNLDNVMDVKKYEGTNKRLPAKECRFPKKKFLNEAKMAGFKLIDEHQILPMQYLIELRMVK